MENNLKAQKASSFIQGSDFDEVKDHVYIKLCNPSKVSDDVVQVPFLNLSMVFYFGITFGVGDDKCPGHLIITKSFLSATGISTDTLVEIALKNTRSLGCKIKDIREVLISLAEKGGDKIPEDLVEDFYNKPQLPMYVATNTEAAYGASVMLFTDKLAELAESVEDSLYILPSSIHEVILVPASLFADEPEFLADLVCSVNVSDVPESEVLSDSVYFYDRISNKVCIAAMSKSCAD